MVDSTMENGDADLVSANQRLLRRRQETIGKEINGIRARDWSRKTAGESLPLAIFSKEILKQFRKERREARVTEIDEYAAAWLQIVDTPLRAATVNVTYHNGFLTVAVNNPTVKNECENFLAESLLAQLRQVLPVVNFRGLKFKLVAQNNPQKHATSAAKLRS